MGIKDKAGKINDSIRESAFGKAYYYAGRAVAITFGVAPLAVAAFVEGARMFTGGDAFPMASHDLHGIFDPMMDRSAPVQVVGLAGEFSATSVAIGDALSELGGHVSHAVGSHISNQTGADIAEVGGQALSHGVIAAVAGALAIKVFKWSPVARP